MAGDAGRLAASVDGSNHDAARNAPTAEGTKESSSSRKAPCHVSCDWTVDGAIDVFKRAAERGG